MEKQNTSSGMGIGMILFIVFLVLKLTDVINWSWWWVTSPLWIPLAAAAVIIGILGVMAIIIEKFSR